MNDAFKLRSNTIIQGRFPSLDTTRLMLNGVCYQYMRLKKTLIMLFDVASKSPFSKVYVIQNTDASMNYIFMVKKDKEECDKMSNADIQSFL